MAPTADQTKFELFHQRWETVNGDWQDRRREYQDNYDQMMGKDIGSPKPWGAQVNSQHTHSQVMTHCAFLQSGLIPTYPYVFAEMPEPWRELESRAQEEYNRRLRDAGFYGFVYRWLRLADSQKLGVAKLGFGVNGPQWSLVHPGNLMWDPSAENLRLDAEWVIEFYRTKSKATLKAERAEGVYNCSDEDWAKVIQYSDSEITTQEQEREQRTGTGTPSFDGDDGHISMYDMVEAGTIYTIHEPTQVVMREIPNEQGYIYYYDLSTFLEVFNVEGYGIPDLARDLQDEINTLRRQRIDIRSLVANPMYTLLKGSGLDPFGIVAAPGAIYSVNNREDLMPLPSPNNSDTLQSEENLLTADYDSLIGIQGQNRGEPGKAGMKATTANLIHGNTNLRLGVTMNLIMDYPLRQFLADYVELSTLVEMPVAITLAEWELVRERAEAGELWLVPHSESYVGNTIEKFNLLMQLFQAIAPITAPPGIAELAKEMLSLVQIRDPEKVTQFIQGNMLPDPVLAANQQQQPQQQQLPMPDMIEQGPPVDEMARASAPMQQVGAP